MESIFIYGPPGSGKSSLGSRLAQALKRPFVDLDEHISAKAGIPIPEIFNAEGETGFRKWERETLADVIMSLSGVIALGGGTLLDDRNRSLVNSVGRVLCLRASSDTLLSRTRTQAGQRPLLSGDMSNRLEMLLSQRADHYASFQHQLDTDKSLESVLWDAQVQLGRFHISGMGQGYDVQVMRGGLEKLGEAIVSRGLNSPVALISDSNVAPLHAGTALDSLMCAGYDVYEIVIPAGESHKHIQTVIDLWNRFLEIGMERGSTVIALGGGVIGDLVGFTSATYLRGVRWVAAPTSLLAMVDASLGGKTGVDLPQGKNLVGSFHPPSLVIADPLTLNTLPIEEQRNGMAEVVKHGVLADADLFALCGKGIRTLQADSEALVRRAMAVKVRVIEEDPYEKARRASLNLGHTLGHAVELASGFKLKHGEAVAIGMVAAARLSEKRGYAEQGISEQIVRVLKILDLPVEIPTHIDVNDVKTAMRKDKKRTKGKARLVLPVRIGEARWGVELPDEDLLDVMINPEGSQPQ